jgi:transcriptional regulator with XRE-family HTH domain
MSTHLGSILLTMAAEGPSETRTSPAFIARVGTRIRALRKDRGWSVQQLADTSSVSRRMLTDIELGHANPSLGTVDRIAHALDTDFAALSLPQGTAGAGPVDATVVWQSGHGSRALLLGATEAPRSELWHWTLAAGDRYDAEPDRPGAQEVHHVLTGELTLELATETQTLAAGETSVIATDRAYAYLNDGADAVVFMRLVAGA